MKTSRLDCSMSFCNCGFVLFQSLEGQHGSLLALGYLIGRIYSHSNNRLGDVTMEDIEEKQEPTKDNDNVTLAVKQIGTCTFKSSVFNI